MIGVGRPELVRLLADALASLGAERAIVFHVANGLDELVPGIPAEGVEVRDGWTRPWKYDPAALRQRVVDLVELAGGDAADNGRMLERMLDGEAGARRETVLTNVAVALTVEGRAGDVSEGYERAQTAVDSGAARAVFDRMRRASREAAEGASSA
jgi:anthranilate phosphoribosyltransferase